MQPIYDRDPRGKRRSESRQQSLRYLWRQHRPKSHQLRLESLESRIVLSPTIFTVDSTESGTSGSGMSGTLPYVISQANANTNTDGSEIEFDSSVFTSSSPQTITLGATLVLSETAGPEMIQEQEAGLVTVSGGGTVSVFEVGSGVTAALSGLTISGGSTSGSGGGLYNNGATTLTNCTISGNSAGSGGGVWNNGTTTLTNCTVVGNSSFQGGAIDNGGNTVVSDSTFSTNSATYGGAIFSYGELNLSSTSFTDNDASADTGGAIYNFNSGTLTMNQGSFTSNSTFMGAPSRIIPLQQR